MVVILKLANIHRYVITNFMILGYNLTAVKRITTVKYVREYSKTGEHLSAVYYFGT